MSPLAEYNGQSDVVITKEVAQSILKNCTEKEVATVLAVALDIQGEVATKKEEQDIQTIKKQLDTLLQIDGLPGDFKERCFELIDEYSDLEKKHIMGTYYTYQDLVHYKYNTSIVIEALKLVQSGSVSFSSDIVNFHTINGQYIGKSLIIKPYESTKVLKLQDQNVYRNKRKNLEFTSYFFANKDNIKLIIQDIVDTHSTEIALYDNFYGKIYDALECKKDIKWSVIRLLTGINNMVFTDFDSQSNRYLDFWYNTNCRIQSSSDGSRSSKGCIYMMKDYR